MIFKWVFFLFISKIKQTTNPEKQAKTKEKSYISRRKNKLNSSSDIPSSMFAKLMSSCYVWRPKGGEKEELLPWMLSRDLRSQASPLCPEEESQIAKIRSRLTPQGEGVKTWSRERRPATLPGLTHNPPSLSFEQKEGSYPCVVEVVGDWVWPDTAMAAL